MSDETGEGDEGGGGIGNVTPALPPKPDVAMALIQAAPSIYVHLDPRGDDVMVPSWFKKQPQLVLQVGMRMAVPIPDLDIGEEALSCTLSFNRSPEYCWIPWSAIYGLVDDEGRGMIWPESVPAEVAAASDGRAAKEKSPERKRAALRLADEAPADEAPPSKEAAAAQGEGSGESDVEPAQRTGAPTARVAKLGLVAAPAATSVEEDPAPALQAVATPSDEAAAPGELDQEGGVSAADALEASGNEEPSDEESSDEAPSDAESSDHEPGGDDDASGGKRKLPPYLRIVK